MVCASLIMTSVWRIRLFIRVVYYDFNTQNAHKSSANVTFQQLLRIIRTENKLQQSRNTSFVEKGEF